MKFSIVFLAPSLSLANLACRPGGPVTPRPRALVSSSTFAQAADNLSSALDQAVAGKAKAGWAVGNTSFSLALVSLDQETPNVPTWEYHHLAENNINGTTHLDRDSQYLIGSVSKVFSDLALLKSGLDLDSVVTDFLPELANGKTPLPWHNVTLRSLGSHLSGTPSNYGFSEYYYLKEVFESLGFPTISEAAYPNCGVIGLNGGCTKQQLLKGLEGSLPINGLNERPAYSNIAFTLLAYAIEHANGKNYATQIQDYIATPLGLKHTFPSPGNSTQAVIPPIDNSWGSDYGPNTPGGGLVSTLSDLSTLLHSILTRKVLPPAQVRAWLKPDSLTGSPSALVGLPWEIYRPSGQIPSQPSYVPTIYAKSGGAFGYRAQIALLDSHGAALVLLTAGDMTALPRLYDAMLGVFVPALDAASREQAVNEVTGKYSTSGCFSASDKPENACIEATLDLNNSMVLGSLTRNGQDMLAALTEIWRNTIGAQLSPIEPSYSIFPTEDITEGTLFNGSAIVRESWRLWLTPVAGEPSASDLPGQGITSNDCIGWTLNDWIHYGGEPVDRLVVVRDVETGKIVGIEVPFLRSEILTRTEIRSNKPKDL